MSVEVSWQCWVLIMMSAQGRVDKVGVAADTLAAGLKLSEGPDYLLLGHCYTSRDIHH